MRKFFVTRVVVTIIIFVVIGISFLVYYFFYNKSPSAVPLQKVSENIVLLHSVLGQSAEGRNIEVYTYGNGKTKLLFVGGIHGGYEWNSVLLAYKFIDYFNADPKNIPANLTIIIIQALNPDGVYKVTGNVGRFSIADVSTDSATLASGRFNGNNVDLNRNFDCKWQPQSTWQSKTVSGGSSAFSEPESKILRDFILKNNPSAVVFWHSQSGTVYASQCKNGILLGTMDIMNAYARASGYSPSTTFDAYTTTGGADDWLTSLGIPAITVELKTHQTVEWEQNLAGLEALFQYYK